MSPVHRSAISHSRLMRESTDRIEIALRLIHGKALFEYLRRKGVRGGERARILNYFYPTRGYHYAIIAEHGVFVRKACSYLCASHVGTGLVQDPVFLDPMQHYENLYAEYFDLYCSTLFPSDGVESASERSLLPLLKHQLGEWRWIILNPRESLPRVKREREIRRSTGDTQRLPHLKLRPRDGV